MPVYTYHCNSCEHEFDQHQSFSDDPLESCPNCQAQALHKVYKPARVVFKGSGYYVTDNRSSKKPSLNNAKAKEASSNGSSETPEKKESKPEKKESKVTEKTD